MSEPKYPLRIVCSFDAVDPAAALVAARRAGKSALMKAWQREIDAKIEQVNEEMRRCWVPELSAFDGPGPNLLTEEKREKPMTWRQDDGEWVRRSDYEAIGAELAKVRKELELAGAVCRLSGPPLNADVISAEDHHRVVAQLKNEREKYKTMWKQVASIGPVMEPPGPSLCGDYETVEQRIDALRTTNDHLRGEVARLEGKWPQECTICDTCESLSALRSQLALAEERKRPARHRPGAVVNVGWDPEGE